MPGILSEGGLATWLILAVSILGAAIFVERVLYFHRAQINLSEFLNGVRTVLKRENIVEAISICEATPGPVPRLVKVAILNRERGRDAIRESIEEAGTQEVPRLEAKLNLLANAAQITPLLGMLGTVLGLMQVFKALEAGGPMLSVSSMSHGVYAALISAAFGICASVLGHLSYNYLISRVNEIVYEMERASTDILNSVLEIPSLKK